MAPQTLRLWERERLIWPERTDRGYRVYREADIVHLKEIKRLREIEGLNYAAIRKQLGSAAENKEALRGSGTSVALEDDSRRRDGTHGPGSAPRVRLRQIRHQARKTLQEISETTGLSISFISALERGDSGASVASLRLLADAYNMNMREIFGADLEQSTPLVRSTERPVMQWDNGVRFEEMATGEKVMDPSYTRIPAYTGSEGFYSHRGEEFVYIISGTLFLELKGLATYELSPGDTLYFPSTIPHRWWAANEPVETVYVNTPPTF